MFPVGSRYCRYGETPEGFLKYVKEQLGALRRCEARGFTMRECALYFEALGLEEERVHFHCDQVGCGEEGEGGMSLGGSRGVEYLCKWVVVVVVGLCVCVCVGGWGRIS